VESNIIGRAVVAYEAIRATRNRRPYEEAVEKFTRILADIPATPQARVSDEDCRLLTTVARGVIECIEQRIDTQKDPGADQFGLVKAVYQIRRDLEKIDHWCHGHDLKR